MFSDAHMNSKFICKMEVCLYLVLLMLYTVGSLNGIYGIKSPFPAPTGSATEYTGILFIFTQGCFLSEVVSYENNQERHRVSIARDF